VSIKYNILKNQRYDDREFDICSSLGRANYEYGKCRASEGGKNITRSLVII
jgi:hypothetical protein